MCSSIKNGKGEIMKTETMENLADLVAITIGNQVSFEEFDATIARQIQDIHTDAGKSKAQALNEYMGKIADVTTRSENRLRTYDRVRLIMIETGLDENSSPELVVQYTIGENRGKRFNLPCSHISNIVICNAE